jgi:large subunit ribosomal protein L1
LKSGRAKIWFAKPQLPDQVVDQKREEKMQRSKKYRAAAEKIEAGRFYTPLEAMKLVKETSTVKYNSTVDISLFLGIDPKKADQAVRSTVNLPHGTGKTARVLVFAAGERAEQARAAGADIVGADELIDEVSKGRLDYDAVVSTPDLMGKVGRLGKVLGPRGLMPNPKTGTVTTDIAKAVSDIKGGKIEFRIDKNANLHFIIGKTSFTAEQLAENYAAAIEEVMRAKPASSKGRFIKSSTVSSTMSPGIKIDTSISRDGGPVIQ